MTDEELRDQVALEFLRAALSLDHIKKFWDQPDGAIACQVWKVTDSFMKYRGQNNKEEITEEPNSPKLRNLHD